MNLFMKQKQTHRPRKQTGGYQRGKGKKERGKGGGGINQEFGITRYKLLHIKQINKKFLLYSTGNYIQYPEINHNKKEYEKEYIYIIYITESLCCIPETNITL